MIWYEMKNTRNYKVIPGIIVVDSKNFEKYSSLIQDTIDDFNSLHEWDNMWGLKEAKYRLDRNHILYLGTDSKGTLAHVWAEKNYLYNIFVNPRRKKNYSEEFARACFNYIDYENLSMYCDDWNIASQKLAPKIGFKKINERMNYTKVYKEYFDKLIDCRNKKIPSIMYPPNYQGDKINDLPEDTATVVFTTGTTGTPKATIHTFESLENIIRINTEILGITKDDVLANFIPTWTIGTYIYTVPTYLKGGNIIHDKFSPDKFQKYLYNVPITTAILIPTMLDMMKDSGLDFDLSNLRNVLVGAEKINKEHLEYVLDLGAQSVTPAYGSSEAIPITLYNTFTKKENIHLGLKEVDTFKYDNKDTLVISGISVSNNEVDTKDNFTIRDGLYYWQSRTDNIVKRKGWKVVEEKEA